MILTKLNQKVLESRHTFDTNSKSDLEEYKYFLTNNKWRNSCPFFLEWPYLTVPDMVKDKIIKNMFA